MYLLCLLDVLGRNLTIRNDTEKIFRFEPLLRLQ